MTNLGLLGIVICIILSSPVYSEEDDVLKILSTIENVEQLLNKEQEALLSNYYKDIPEADIPNETPQSDAELAESPDTITTNEDESEPVTSVEGKIATLANETVVSNETQKVVNCLPRLGSPEVQLVNDTELIKLLLPDPNVTSRDTPGVCVLVLFYSKHCPFSSMAAPHYNSLPRAFPDVKMVAINAMIYHLFNTQNGIVGVPSIMLFHSGRAVAKFNDSEYTLELFSKFVTKHTGIEAEAKSHVTSADFSGPVTSVPSKDSDSFLIISWLFIIICGGYYFTKSRIWKWIIETIQSNWRESEAHAQHEHEHQD